MVGGREIRIGGYGFPISDEGSGADLGLHAIRLALRAHDERTVDTSLTRDVMMRFRNDPFEAVAWMDRATATDYATFAPLVMRHADDGDPVARRIVSDAAEQIDDLVRRLAECGAPRVALLGGLASSMQPWLAPDVQRRLVAVEGDAVDGALHLAHQAAMSRSQQRRDGTTETAPWHRADQPTLCRSRFLVDRRDDRGHVRRPVGRGGCGTWRAWCNRCGRRGCGAGAAARRAAGLCRGGHVGPDRRAGWRRAATDLQLAAGAGGICHGRRTGRSCPQRRARRGQRGRPECRRSRTPRSAPTTS